MGGYSLAAVYRLLASVASLLWSMGSTALQHLESSWTGNGTHVPCIGRQILNHWTTREVLERNLKQATPFGCFPSLFSHVNQSPLAMRLPRKPLCESGSLHVVLTTLSLDGPSRVAGHHPEWLDIMVSTTGKCSGHLYVGVNKLT